MQKKRNIRLLITLLVTITAVVVAYFATRPEDVLQVNRGIFAYDDPSEINRIVFTNDSTRHILAFRGNQWEVNNTYEADPRRVSVLFAILKQMRVRRKVAKQQQDSIGKQLNTLGTEVTFYEGTEPVHSFYVWGDENSGLTYVADSPDHPVYIVEIPGYRSFLAGIFQLDVSGWRDPLVFDMNWANLQSVKATYPREPEKSFSIAYDDGFYSIPEMSEVDSSRLVDYLDDVSLLYVNDYLNEEEVKRYRELISEGPQASIQVKDVGENVYTLEIYSKLPEGSEIIGRIDSTDYAVFEVDKIRNIMRPRRYFVKNHKVRE